MARPGVFAASLVVSVAVTAGCGGSSTPPTVAVPSSVGSSSNASPATTSTSAPPAGFPAATGAIAKAGLAARITAASSDGWIVRKSPVPEGLTACPNTPIQLPGATYVDSSAFKDGAGVRGVTVAVFKDSQGAAKGWAALSAALKACPAIMKLKTPMLDMKGPHTVGAADVFGLTGLQVTADLKGTRIGGAAGKAMPGTSVSAEYNAPYANLVMQFYSGSRERDIGQVVEARNQLISEIGTRFTP